MMELFFCTVYIVIKFSGPVVWCFMLHVNTFSKSATKALRNMRQYYTLNVTLTIFSDFGYMLIKRVHNLANLN